MDNKIYLILFEVLTEIILALLIIICLAPNLLSFEGNIIGSTIKISADGIMQLPQQIVIFLLIAAFVLLGVIIFYSLSALGQKTVAKRKKKWTVT